MNRPLDVINKDDNIVGMEEREVIHREGLLHREIHIWFYTPKGEIIFQHRAEDKDVFPDKLDVAVGGHVEVGEDYHITALQEAREETGLKLEYDDLVYLSKMIGEYSQPERSIKNIAMRTTYIYLFTGEISDLKIETGKAIGFESWAIDKLLNLTEQEKQRFVPFFDHPEWPMVVEYIQKQLSLK
ncbi:MAG: NUDIX domain-containing protein [Candidatus Falkowbacteria bacterium]